MAKPLVIALLGHVTARRIALERIGAADTFAFVGGITVVEPPAATSKADLENLHRDLAAHLSDGRSVLTGLAPSAEMIRRALLDAAARFQASTLALVSQAPAQVELGDFIAELGREGWTAVVLMSPPAVHTGRRTHRP